MMIILFFLPVCSLEVFLFLGVEAQEDFRRLKQSISARIINCQGKVRNCSAEIHDHFVFPLGVALAIVDQRVISLKHFLDVCNHDLQAGALASAVDRHGIGGVVRRDLTLNDEHELIELSCVLKDLVDLPVVLQFGLRLLHVGELFCRQPGGILAPIEVVEHVDRLEIHAELLFIILVQLMDRFADKDALVSLSS